MGLNEVGKLKTLNNLRNKPTVRVIMAIKAPKGECQLFEPNHPYNIDKYQDHAEAIKAFMEQNNA